MEMMPGILKVSLLLGLVGLSPVLAGLRPTSLQQQGVKSSYNAPQASSLETLETVTSSEVEYVDGPLAPLYDFLIQRRLFRFCKLLRDAGLEEVLQNLGGYWTVFVPTDSSFVFLPGGTLDQLKRNPQQLRDFVLYHFVTGDFQSSQILNEMLVDSAQGAPLRFNIYGNIITVSGAQILEPDLQFEQGRVYIIDHPLYPVPSSDLVSYLRTSHQRLYRLLLDAGLVDYLSSGTFTILAPDDDAFGFLSAEFTDILASNRTLAERILLNHILPGSLYTGGIIDGMRWDTAGGEVITFTTNRGLIFANGIPIVIPDVPFTNGVIHVLNRVLLPEGVDADCQCKPSSDSSRQPQSPGSSRYSPGQPQSPTTRRPIGQSFPRQTNLPFGRQPPSSVIAGQGTRPVQPGQLPQDNAQGTRPGQPGLQPQAPGQSTRPGQPAQQPQEPFTPSRIGATLRPIPQPGIQTQPEDDFNTVGGPGNQPTGGQWQPQQTTRYPPPPRQVPTPRVTAQPPRAQQPSRGQPPQSQQPSRTQQPTWGQQPPRAPQPSWGQQPPRAQQPAWGPKPPIGQQPQTPSDNIDNPEQEKPSVVTIPPQTTARWVNRQPTQAPRYPTPPRSPYRTPATQRPQTTRSYQRVTPPVVGKVSIPGAEISTEIPQQEIQTPKPNVQTSSWQRRQQITQATRMPTQQRATNQPSRPALSPQRRPTQPRPGSFSTPEPTLPQRPDQPSFESNRNRPKCRQRDDILTPGSQNLPVCPDSEPCQSPPYNPSDTRPLCPITPSGCRDANEPFNPSDTRPQCPPSLPGQGCRVQGEPTYTGDIRPLCSPSPPSSVGCRDSSAPFSPTDNRPICDSTGTKNPVTPSQGMTQPQGCRQSTDPADGRPLCSSEADCRPFLERPKPGDLRPVCKVNRQTPQQRPNDSMKGQGKLPQPQQRPTYPQSQGSRSPGSQTTRRPSWQTTVGPQDITNQVFAPGQSPASGNIRAPSPPSQPQGGNLPGKPQSDSRQPSRGTWQTTVAPQDISNQVFTPGRPPASGSLRTPSPPSQPQSGKIPGSSQSVFRQPQPGSVSQPPSGSYPFRPTNSPYPAQPQTDIRPVQPQPPSTGTSRPYQPPVQTLRPQSQASYPQGANTQTPSYPVNQPGSADISVNQPFVPQRRPVSPTRQTGSVTSYPGRGTNTPRAPISVTGTSTPGEDSRRSLYEIVEDPALLIKGTPVKLTKIFSLFHKAGIEDILSGPGPITVFLPSDDAFATLPKGVVDQLEENPELLRQILLYHVANAEVLPTAQEQSYTVPSLEGNQLVITMLNGGRLILISGAKAIAVTRANNGIFYVVNQLLYPLPQDNIFGAIQSRPDLSTLSMLLPMSGLTDMLQGQTPYTFLAPTDNAFAQLSPAVLQELTQNTTALQEILLNHIIDGAHYGREFLTGGTFPSARGGKLKFQVVSYGYQVNEINIKTPEIITGTGVIHLIDQVLLEDSDLRFFQTLDNTVNGQDDSISTNQQSFQQPATGTQTGTRQPVFGGQRLPPGQPQVTGLIPPSHQQIGARAPSGQRTTLRPTGGQTQVSGQTPFGGQRNPQPQISGQTPFGGQRNPQPQIPGQTALGSQRIPQPQTSGQSSSGGKLTIRGQSTFTGQRQPSFQPQNIPGGNVGTGQRVNVGTGQQVNFGAGQQINVGAGQQANVADLARSMGLNRFADWMTNTGLLEKIHDGGLYTVFAPTDEAINSLPQDMVSSIDSNPEQTKPLLQYHVVPRRINLNSLTNDETSGTLLQGKTLRFNVYPSVQPDCRQLITAAGAPVGDALATMGSVQVIPITQVLYQPTGNLLNIVEASPILQELSRAIKAASLNWVISGSGPLTFFAPSDTAFQSLTPEQRKNLIEDKQAFTDLIKKHLVKGTYFSSGVQEDLQKTSEKNTPVTLSLQEGILTINSVPVTYSDITATNGVLHVIDQFL